VDVGQDSLRVMKYILITREERYRWSTTYAATHLGKMLKGFAEEHAAGLRYVEVLAPDAHRMNVHPTRLNDYCIKYEIINTRKFMMEALKYGIRYTMVTAASE
jgi:hypothetical protein